MVLLLLKALSELDEGGRVDLEKRTGCTMTMASTNAMTRLGPATSLSEGALTIVDGQGDGATMRGVA